MSRQPWCYFSPLRKGQDGLILLNTSKLKELEVMDWRSRSIVKVVSGVIKLKILLLVFPYRSNITLWWCKSVSLTKKHG